MFKLKNILFLTKFNNRMKIAIPTNDRKTIAKRTGRCEEFAVYEITNNKVISADYRKNTHDHDHEEEEHEHSHSDIMELLSDADMMIVQMVGKHMKSDLEKSNLEYQKTKESDIETILNTFLEK